MTVLAPDEANNTASYTSLSTADAAAFTAAYSAYTAAQESTVTDRADRGAYLATLAQAGRDAGWSLAIMATHCLNSDAQPISPERLRQIIAAYLPDGQRPTVPTIAQRVKPAAEEKPKQVRRALTRAERTKVHNLAARAKTAGLGSPAEREFTATLRDLHDDRVPWRLLVEPSGMTVAGMRRRVATHKKKTTTALTEPIAA